MTTPPSSTRRRQRTGRAVAFFTSGALIGLTSLVAVPAVAAGSATAVLPTALAVDAPVVINEVYGGGGNSGATVTHDFVELLNTSDAPVSLAGLSVQYKSTAGTLWNGVIPLSGSVPAGETYLVGGASGGAVGAGLPTPDATSSVNLSGTNGNVALVSGATALTCLLAACSTDPDVVDLVGFGTGDTFAGAAAAPAGSNTRSISRTAGINTVDNGADFTAGAPTPTNLAGETLPEPEPEPEPGPATARTIAEIQGDGGVSPHVGMRVVTTGVVTASYPTGGFNGFVVQTAGTGGSAPDPTPGSDAVFVYTPGLTPPVIGTSVEVTGTVAEFNGLTQVVPASAAEIRTLAEVLDPVEPTEVAWPETDAEREVLESMLVTVTGPLTVANTYSTNQYGEVGLASGTTPLRQPTDVARPGTPEADAVVADNAARGVVLDDGASTNFLGSGNSGLTPPYLSLTNPVRVGAAATIVDPVVVDYRNNTWKLNPTAAVGPGSEPATFVNTRTTEPDSTNLGSGALSLASFNVLNYFTTLGADVQGCTSYKDRTGDPVTVNSCPGNGPRGAFEAEDLERQQDKIVAAVSATGADVVGLMEIENSAVLGETPDEAVATLTAALNTLDGPDTWAYVGSSGDLPARAQQDVITNALIYRTAAVRPVGAPVALGTASAATGAFVNAREPIGQVFEPAAGGERFLAIVNHFKSKGSAGPLPGDADSGDGQGSSNASRVAQATALRDWVGTVLTEKAALGTPVEDVALLGDFNSYTHEDPLELLYDAGYVNAVQTHAPGEYTYSFSGLAGSLDHVLLNGSFADRVTGADVWEINSPESIALEYSRHNYHGTLFWDETPYRSSDHDPIVVAFDAGTPAPTGTEQLSLLNINDFHGRIDANATRVAGTIERVRAALPDSTVFLSNGDNIGASLFASAMLQDNPTLDMLDALDLDASGVGNHEFDQGYDDLVGRVADRVDFPYLGANVYLAGTTDPALPQFTLVETPSGVTVGVIGVVTEETPTLVSPAGVAGLDFGDPVEAVNRVAAILTDGDELNGEADVLVAEYHEGAGSGTPDGATLEEEVAAGGAFADIVTGTSPEVDVIFTGHTHKQYAWQAPVTGTDRTRPVLQTGSYGENIGHVVLTLDATTHEVTASTARNVARTTAPEDSLVAAYPRVGEVKGIVDAALAESAVIGGQVVGSVSADVTTAYTGGTWVDGVYTVANPTQGRDDRGSESTLGNLVADSLRDTLAAPERGGATIGVVNPGGLRAELLHAASGAEADGEVTFAEANAVLPFVNNLWSTTLTGAQLVTLLEQQWQTDANGNVPSRAYLQLGLSDNVAYTFDATREHGDRITSVTIDGQPLDEATDYRIATFSFLAQGGDNFRIFAEGTDTRDSGLIDRDAWVTYLEENNPVAPSFARRSVSVEGAPSTVQTGAQLALSVARLDLTSLGSPQNTSVTGTFHGPGLPAAGVELGTWDVTAGAAQVAGAVPAAASGATSLTLVAAPSDTTVTVPVTVETAPVVTTPTTTRLAVSGDRVAGSQLTFTATVAPAAAVGNVEIRSGSTLVGRAAVSNGTATVKATLTQGSHSVRAVFVPIDPAAFSTSQSTATSLTIAPKPVVKSAVTVRAKLAKKSVTYPSRGKVTVTVVGATAAPKGKVEVRRGRTVVATGTLKVSGRTGTATITLPRLTPAKYALTAHYAGTATTLSGSSKVTTLTVKKAKASVKAALTKKGRVLTVRVTASGTTPSGKITVRVDGKKIRTVTVKAKGSTRVTLPRMKRGTHTVKVSYSGSKNVSAATKTLKVRIR